MLTHRPIDDSDAATFPGPVLPRCVFSLCGGLLLASTALTSCEAEQPADTAEATIQFALDRLADESDPSVVWEMLPPSYQSDIHGWCKRLAAELPGDAYDKLFVAIRQAGITLKMKAEDLLSFAPIQYATRMMGNVGEDQLIAMFEAIGDIHILLGDSDIASKDKLATIDLGKFLHETGPRLWNKAAVAYRVTGKNPATVLADMTYQTVNQTDTTAEIAVTVDGNTRSIQFVKVEDRWIPADLVESWQNVRSSVEEFFSFLAQPDTKEKIVGFEKKLDDVLAGLEKLQKTSGRTQFANALQEMVGEVESDAKNLLPFMNPKNPR